MDSALFPPEFRFFFFPGRLLFSLKVDCTSDGVDWTEEGNDSGVSNADRDHLGGTGGGVQAAPVPPPTPAALQFPSSSVVGRQGL